MPRPLSRFLEQHSRPRPIILIPTVVLSWLQNLIVAQAINITHHFPDHPERIGIEKIILDRLANPASLECSPLPIPLALDQLVQLARFDRIAALIALVLLAGFDHLLGNNLGTIAVVHVDAVIDHPGRLNRSGSLNTPTPRSFRVLLSMSPTA